MLGCNSSGGAGNGGDNVDGGDKDDPSAVSYWYRDRDRDGYGDPTDYVRDNKQPVGYTSNNSDCDDNDYHVKPSATEVCGDGIDQDCNGSDLACPIDPLNIDDDGDNYTENHGDCDDDNADINPGAIEVCGDGIDQDCNGSDLACPIDPLNIDDDGDGFTENQGDCNDFNDSIHPDATEVCGDGIDQDCDGSDRSCGIILISAYMEIKHNQEFSAFEEDEKAIDSELAASGLYNSSVHVNKYIDNVKAHIQSFVDVSIDYVSLVAQHSMIDSIELEELFDRHKDIDASYYMMFTNEHIGSFAPNLITNANNEIMQFIDDTYDLAKLELAAL